MQPPAAPILGTRRRASGVQGSGQHTARFSAQGSGQHIAERRAQGRGQRRQHSAVRRAVGNTGSSVQSAGQWARRAAQSKMQGKENDQDQHTARSWTTAGGKLRLGCCCCCILPESCANQSHTVVCLQMRMMTHQHGKDAMHPHTTCELAVSMCTRNRGVHHTLSHQDPCSNTLQSSLP